MHSSPSTYRRVSRRLASRLAIFATLAPAAFAPAAFAPAASAYGVALHTSVDTAVASGDFERLALTHIGETGAQFMRLAVNWNEIAPRNPRPDFDPSNPDSAGYEWVKLDREIIDAISWGLTPFLTVLNAPSWAQDPPGSGEERPDPVQLALFARALASHYDGTHFGLPWVRYLEVWNEPNVSFFLRPQIENGQVVSVGNYRAMINYFAAAVHGVRADDVVIAGALFPNGIRRANLTAIAALDFTRRLLCMSAGAHPRRICDATVNADAWSVHPYTSGGPSTRSANPDNVWIYNLGALTSLVKAAQLAGTLNSTMPVQTWVTEFSWDSNPPDSQGVPMRLEQRWVAEALFRAWRAGVSVFSWYSLRDDPIGVSSQQAGLYFACPHGIACDTAKPVERAFRFPFVALRSSKRRVLLWGRTPAGAPGVVAVQWRQGGFWQALTTLSTDPDGIFTATRTLPLGVGPHTVLRAVIGSEVSPSFSLHHPPDIPVMPFGS